MVRKLTEWIIGIDEVGRGPLAGPVTICAFAIRRHAFPRIANDETIRDSKKLSPQKRERVATVLHDLVREGVAKYEIASSSSSVIDRKGIVRAITIAISSALEKLAIHPIEADIYLDGGLSAPIRYFRQHTIIRGDDSMRVISAASILAKVHRDRLMEDYDLRYPHYQFFDNKGYGTKAHVDALKSLGPSPLHRLTFLSGLS